MPHDIDEISADIFLVFTGWSPRDIDEMPITELVSWHEKALERLKIKMEMGV